MSNDKNDQFDIQKALQHAEEYINTYSEQERWEEYSQETWIDDLLYMIGISISDEFAFADGFRRFKAELQKKLEQ